MKNKHNDEKKKVICTMINLMARKLSNSKGGCCMSESMVVKLKKPKKTFCEIGSLIDWMRFINNKYNEDDFYIKSANSDFIDIVEGCLREKASPKEDIEWL